MSTDIYNIEPRKNLPDELRGNIHGGIKSAAAWGVKWVVGVRFAAVIPAIVGHSADVPEGPSRNAWGPRDVPSVGLQEVDLVQWSAIASTPQQCEKDQQDGGCHEEQAQKAQ